MNWLSSSGIGGNHGHGKSGSGDDDSTLAESVMKHPPDEVLGPQFLPSNTFPTNKWSNPAFEISNPITAQRILPILSIKLIY